MGRIWKAVLIAVEVLRKVFNGDGFILTVGFCRENGRLKILLERSKWDNQTAERVKAAHQNQVGYTKKMQIEKKSST